MAKEIKARSILNKHRKRDPWFLDDYSVNPYQLCDFNCIYCYIRGSKYGANMGHELAVKVNAVELLERELMRRARKREYGFIALSSATEPWMHIEEKYMLTRKCLNVIARYRFPVHCMTKSTLILRDLDILAEIDVNAILPDDLKKLGHGTLVTFSFSTLDEKVAKIFEPGAPTVSERLNAIKEVKDQGFHCGIAFMPLLPYISDSKDAMEEMVKTARELNADYVFFGDLTLYGAGKELYFKVLEQHFPDLVPKYKALYMGKPYASKRYRANLYRIAKKLCEKHGVKWMIL